MDNHDILMTKNKILNVFDNNKDSIFNTWINLFEKNEKIQHEVGSLINIFKNILENYIDYFKNENKNQYLSSIMNVVREMDINDVSYNDFMMYIPYFQESYTSVLMKNLKIEDIEEGLILCNRVYNKTLVHIQNEYLNVKDPTLTAMLKLSELRDDVTGHHVERTKEYAVALSRALNLDEKFLKYISKASLLHDIGKIAVRDEILLKPGKLTNSEYEEIKKHTVIGARAISNVIKANEYIHDYLYMAIDIALCHHEKYDGSGYPNGLNESKIPLSARIFAIADAYDVITSERPYKKALSHEEAVRRIQLDSGKHFDPHIVNKFMRVQDKFQIINNKYKN
ncbi:MAG: HD domain-containing protein [Bacillota bacterium]|nr:HD domain-containing protein [Bacillota bacterium]